MHRIDTKTAQKDKFGAGKNGFTRGNPQTGTPATDLDDDYFDMLQEELCSVVEASGASLEKGRHDQLLTALRALLLSRNNPFGDIKSDGTVPTALENLGLGEGSALPVGVPVPWPLATPPTGWLKCNGTPFSAEEYPKLAKVYPTNELPDLRGEFIRGWDDGRGVDSGRLLLSAQDASGVGTFSGGYSDGTAYIPVDNPDKAYPGPTDWTHMAYSVALIYGQTFYAVRPRNIAFNYIVRAA
ncbi:tail fiber protein [Escherichia coli]|nr:phage tail protein [Escherichia coli]QEY48624.1 tail fiber protein [Escherichia coli]